MRGVREKLESVNVPVPEEFGRGSGKEAQYAGRTCTITFFACEFALITVKALI